MYNIFVRRDYQLATRNKQDKTNFFMLNGFFILNVWSQVLLLLVTAGVFITAYPQNPDPEMILELIDEFGDFWLYHLRWCVLVILLGLIYFWPVYFRCGSKLIDKYYRIVFLWQTVLFALCAGISFWVIQINHIFMISNALVNPVEALYLARADFVKSDNLPISRAEILERCPNLFPLEFYGHWCYFYRPEESDYYLVVNYYHHWFVYDKTDKLEMTDLPRESAWWQVIDQCQQETRTDMDEK